MALPMTVLIDAIAERTTLWMVGFQTQENVSPADIQEWMDVHEQNCEQLVSLLEKMGAVGYPLPVRSKWGDLYVDLDSCVSPGQYRALVKLMPIVDGIDDLNETY